MPFMLALIAAFLMTLQAPAAIRSIDKGLDSQMDAARQATVRTAAEWEALWRLHGGERTRPAVDFGKEMVVAVFMGSRPTAGFSVEIVAAGERDGKFVVGYRETQPAPGGVSAQVLTAPYHIAVVAKSLLPITFEKQQ